MIPTSKQRLKGLEGASLRELQREMQKRQIDVVTFE
jgi:hypothetical protein